MPTCNVCGKRPAVAVCCSGYGAASYAYCQYCLDHGLEPYLEVVAYIACAGHFPQDINEFYQMDVRRMLPLWGKTEAEFIHDVDEMIEQCKEGSGCQ